MGHFQRVGLLGNLDLPEVKESLQRLETFLISQGRDVVYEQQTAKLVDWPVENVFSITDFSASIVLCIVLGVDGIILSPSRKWSRFGIPFVVYI